MRRYQFDSLLLILLLSATPAWGGKIKCWTNSDGVRECGNVIPPEYVDQGTETINERGITVDKRERAKTKAEREAEKRRRELEAEREAEAEERREEQAAYDRALLATFSSVQDIIDSRDRKLAAIDATIELAKVTIGSLKQKLADYRQRAARLERAGKPLPDDLVQDMKSIQAQIQVKREYVASKHEEKKALEEKYAADIERFRELTGDR